MSWVTQRIHNTDVICRILKLRRDSCPGLLRVPSYEYVIRVLNGEGTLTSRGDYWTRKSLLRMLQRQGFGGLDGLFSAAYNEGIFRNLNTEIQEKSFKFHPKREFSIQDLVENMNKAWPVSLITLFACGLMLNRYQASCLGYLSLRDAVNDYQEIYDVYFSRAKFSIDLATGVNKTVVGYWLEGYDLAHLRERISDPSQI